MKNTICKYTKITAAIAMGVALAQAQLAMAGWTGAMNGIGYGQASVNVSEPTGGSRTVNTTNMQDPSVAMTNTPTYVFGGALPKRASLATTAKVKGFSGYVWQATTVGSNGDSTDNVELESRIQITPADCASLDMTSSAVIAPDDKSGTITMTANGTAGTAVWTRGFELPEGLTLPVTTNISETLEFLKTQGFLKWDVLLVGPFGLNTSNCTAVTIPFTVETNASKNLYFVTDGVAKSLPLVITCPPSFSVGCEQPFVYPPVQFAGCGDVTLTYSPENIGTFPPGSFPVGVTPVTVTATDKDGNTTNCTFSITVTDTAPPVIPELLPLTGEASVTVTVPVGATDNCGGTVSVSTTNSLFYTNQGTFTVYWDFADGNLNTNTVPQTVIVDDVTAPVPPTIATASNQCSVTVTAPTATDNVVGSVTGTTSHPLTYTTQGTYTITWTFNDGNGNTSTASQTVVVKDTIPPVKPTLANVTGSCGASVTLTKPTTTDNCAGTVTGTTTTVFPITTAGTTVVTWTFNDGNGNSSTANQTVVVTSLTFKGFYSPVGTVNNTINNPVTRTAGASFPLKWDMLCGTSPITGGTPPTVDIQKVSPSVGSITPLVAEYQNDWHINWPTPSATRNDIYKATVNLPDGSKAVLFVKFK